MKKTASHIQMVKVKKEIKVGVRSTRRTHNTEFPVQIGKPFTYTKTKTRFIKHNK